MLSALILLVFLSNSSNFPNTLYIHTICLNLCSSEVPGTKVLVKECPHPPLLSCARGNSSAPPPALLVHSGYTYQLCTTTLPIHWYVFGWTNNKQSEILLSLPLRAGAPMAQRLEAWWQNCLVQRKRNDLCMDVWRLQGASKAKEVGQ